MIDLNAIQAYHQAYKKALELHRLWEDLDETELLARYEKFRPLADAVLVTAGDNWSRRADLRRHLGYIDTNLKAGRKGNSTSDINDLIYADFPAMFDHLLKNCSVLRAESAPSG